MEGVLISLRVIHQVRNVRNKDMFGGYGVGWGWCLIVGENGGWRIRGVIEINARVRTLIIYKFRMSLEKKMSLVRN